jgi:hypothetical protein
MLKLWQELQEIKPDFDNRVSKNNIFPSSTIAAFSGFTGLIGCIGSLAANTCTDINITPTDNSEAVSLRIIIVENLLKNTAVMAQPVTPKLNVSYQNELIKNN